MEQDKQNLLEMMDRPAFFVKDEVILYANQMARNRALQAGTPIEPILAEQMHIYREFVDGCLYLTLMLAELPCGATVIRQAEGDLFLLDRDLDHIQMQTLALAGKQVRAPLANALVAADLLMEQVQDDTAQAETVAQLRRSLFQLLRVSTNMADGERYELLNNPNYENTEMASFLREVIQKAQTMLEGSGVTLRYDGLPRAAFSLADREHLQRAIHNLIANAVKFSPKGSCVTVTARRIDNCLRITVEDSGEGIPPHIQGSLFHRYQREASIEDSRFGLGLGMLIVRTAAANHKGTVLVDQHKGTRVTMTLTLLRSIPGHLRCPTPPFVDYLGGQDAALVELSEVLPTKQYK